MQTFLIRYGEIGTKSNRIRRNFINILVQNIERTFLENKKEVFIERDRGRIYAYSDKSTWDYYKRIFGIVSFSPVIEATSEIDDIKKTVDRYLHDIHGRFAVRARRTGDHEYSSPELAGEIGAYILEKKPELEVDLDEPDSAVNIEVRNDRAYIFTQVHKGPGGLPLGTQGKTLAFVENRNDFAAAWLMMKRGARQYIFSTDENEWTKRLKIWDPALKYIDDLSIRDVNSGKLPDEVNGLVLGDTVNSMRDIDASNIELPVFRPLIGFTDDRIQRLMEKVEGLSGHNFD